MAGPYPSVRGNHCAVAEIVQQPVILGIIQKCVSSKEKESVALCSCTYGTVRSNRDAENIVYQSALHDLVLRTYPAGHMYVAQPVALCGHQHLSIAVDNNL